ncbi:MAG: oligosaccharide flippase family protein [Saprospiraceae bacterium]|nr:oligosaccharide flippase family protein [Saprospiraceae bacterium]
MFKVFIYKIFKNHALILMLAIAGVNAGNYLLNLLLGRFLGPEDFAEAGILATMVMVLSFIAVGIQMTAAKYSAELKEEGSEEKLLEFQSWITRKTLISSIFLTFLIVLLIPVVQSYLHFRSPVPFILIFIGVPVYFLMSVQRGFLQGAQEFKRFAGTYIAEMIGRISVTVIAIAYVRYYDINGYSEAVSLGFLASFIFSLVYTGRLKIKSLSASNDLRKSIFSFFIIMMCYEGTQIAISYSDVILVKHYFENHESGLYAALSLLGRIVYFGTWALVMVLVPKVIEKAKKGLSTTQNLIQALTIIISFGMSMVIGTAIFPDLLVSQLLGSEYLPMSSFLWKYALATTLFAAANVIAYYYLSLGKYLPVALSALVGTLQVIMIVFNHQSIINIINIQMILMSFLLVGMIIYHLSNPTQYENRNSISLSSQ